MAEPFFNLEINSEQLIDGVEVVDEAIEETKKSAKDLEKIALKRMNRVVTNIRLTWGLLQGMIRAAGGSITMTSRLVVSAGLGAVQALYPILYAAFHGGVASMNMAAVSASLMGIGELGSAVSALIAFESGQKELSLRLRGLNFTMSNMSMMLSTATI